VPLVCVPDQRDQPDNAARVVSCGAGVRVHKRSSPAKLRRVIVAALANPELKRDAHAMSEALARKDGAVQVAEALETIGSATVG
jgi:UDP:flavonoid glycosyltransferase YjiC (YdhE family)